MQSADHYQRKCCNFQSTIHSIGNGNGPLLPIFLNFKQSNIYTNHFKKHIIYSIIAIRAWMSL